jgi:pimeloyl-[acyl-carrier protein] methyl ester esterase
MEGSDLLFGPLKEAAPVGVEVLSTSYPPGEANSYADLLPLVRAMLPRERPFYLLGWSFSGPLALMISAERPAGLRGVILAASFVRKPIPLPTWMRHLARPALFKLYPASYQVKALLSGTEVRSLRKLVAEAHSSAGAVALATRARAAMAVDTSEILKACRVPVMYLRAADDRLIAASRAEEARRLLPTLIVESTPGPHMALVTNPTMSWQALQRFMDTVEGAPMKCPTSR